MSSYYFYNTLTGENHESLPVGSNPHKLLTGGNLVTYLNWGNLGNSLNGNNPENKVRGNNPHCTLSQEDISYKMWMPCRVPHLSISSINIIQD